MGYHQVIKIANNPFNQYALCKLWGLFFYFLFCLVFNLFVFFLVIIIFIDYISPPLSLFLCFPPFRFLLFSFFIYITTRLIFPSSFLSSELQPQNSFSQFDIGSPFWTPVHLCCKYSSFITEVLISFYPSSSFFYFSKCSSLLSDFIFDPSKSKTIAKHAMYSMRICLSQQADTNAARV